jgi:hypothetical protein
MPMKNPPHPGSFVLRRCIEPLGLSITNAAAAQPCLAKGQSCDETARSLFFCRLGRKCGRREGARVDHRQEQHY